MAVSKRKDNKGRVLKTGESQRKDNTYMYRWTDVHGKRQTVYDTTLEGLRQQQEMIKLEIIQGVCRQNITLNQQIERYLATKATLASSTYENYVYYFEHCIKNEPIGEAKIADLKKSDLLLYYKEQSEEHDLSNGTIHILHKIIHPALELAVDDDLIRKNPTKGAMKEYPVEDEVKYALTPEQENELLERVKARPRMKRHYPLIAVMLYTGMRIGETVGLTWSDIDMQNRTININHQLQYRRINGEMKLYCIDQRKNKKKGSTKTKSGERIIPMNDRVYELFRLQRKEWLRINKDANFEVDGYKDFVFLSNRTGRCIYPANVRRILTEIESMNSVRDVHLPHISPHILRHTASTRYAEAGLDVKTIQYLMGHSDVKTTIKTYNHVDIDRAKREMQKYSEWQNVYTNFYTNLS